MSRIRQSRCDCGANIPDGAEFCPDPECGLPAEYIFCDRCGEDLPLNEIADEDGNFFCEECIQNKRREEKTDALEAAWDAAAEYASRLGWSYRKSASELSEALYLLLERGKRSLKIRFALHAPRPSYAMLYGEADFEFGDHEFASTNELDELKKYIWKQTFAGEKR